MFGSLIKRYREEVGCTQAELVSRIQGIEKSFESLDEITLSRWENGRTQPTRKKQILLLIYFGYLKEFNSIYGDEASRFGRFDKIVGKRFRDNFSLSDSPYVDSSKKILVKYYSYIPEERVWFYLDYVQNIHKINTDLDEFKSLVTKTNSTNLYEFYSEDGRMLGHFLYFIVDSEIIQNKLSEKIKTDYVFDRDSSLYVLTCYSSSKDVFMFHNKIVLDALVESEITPKYIYVKCFFSELINFYEGLGGVVVVKGPSGEVGIKYQTGKYQWLLYKVDVIEMLSSKIFYVDENIINDKFSIEYNI
ncbi:hypothetical protein TW81_12265 [Vibrio galatheae]|uniref:HTH cro/C1-type domain-containing protein n=1 Tax=Vibrio galatheae TaxID=579748 RepID=A0A0F4NLP6_9VIBR|nr:helix-turn-helix transcriptional regulator [Vibrio galatheae]KJY82966.1 hypothetical protein TW81_12265 [Vibrio galatheae]